MHKFTFILAFCFIALLTACSITPKTSREGFLSSLGERRTNYVQFYEVSIEGLVFLEDDVHRKLTNVLHGVKSSATNCHEVLEKVKRIQRIAEDHRHHKLSLIDQLRGAYNPKTDTVFYYYHRTAHDQEFGWLILSQTQIKHKVILGEGRVIPIDEF